MKMQYTIQDATLPYLLHGGLPPALGPLDGRDLAVHVGHEVLDVPRGRDQLTLVGQPPIALVDDIVLAMPYCDNDNIIGACASQAEVDAGRFRDQQGQWGFIF